LILILLRKIAKDTIGTSFAHEKFSFEFNFKFKVAIFFKKKRAITVKQREIALKARDVPRCRL
jgi:hypothetical protein